MLWYVTFGDHARMTEVVEKDLGELEAKFIDNGKSYGFEGAELHTYVEARLKEVEDREERKSSRDRGKLEEIIRKLESRVEEIESEAQRSDVLSINEEQHESSSRSSPVRIKLPKYDGKQTGVHYLELFEEIAERNSFRSEEWLLRLRVVVTGTKLEKCCFGCCTYLEAKRELLVAYRTTAERAWRNLVSIQHQAEESFHHFLNRVGRAVSLWAKLTVAEVGVSSEDESVSRVSVEELDPTQEALVKQAVLESECAELCAFMLECKCYQMSLVDFQEAGMSYQEAHRRKPRKQVTTRAPPLQPTAQCMQVAVNEVSKKLQNMTMEERAEFARAERLC